MKSKNLVILMVVAVVLVALAHMSSQKNRQLTEAGQALGKFVFPSLQKAETLNEIERIVIQSADNTMDVAKANDVWVAPDKFSYPLKYDKVHDFVRLIAGLKVGQVLPGDPGQMTGLALSAPGAAGTNTAGGGTLVRFVSKDGNVASFVLGKEHKRAGEPDPRFGAFGNYPDGRYLAFDNKAYLVWDPISGVPTSSKDWLDSDLVSVPATEVTELTLTPADGKPIVLRRPEGGVGDLTLADLSKKEVMNATKAGSVAGVLHYLTFEDVADPALTDKDTGLDKPAATYVAKAKDGRTYTLRIGGKVKGSEDRYGKLDVEFVAPKEEAEPKDDKKPEVAKPASTNLTETTEAEKKEEARKKKQEELEKQKADVRDLSAKLGPWTYVLKSSKVNDALFTRDQLVEDKAKKEAEKKEADKKAAEEKAAGNLEAGTPDAAKSDDDEKKDSAGEKKGFWGRLFGGDDKKDDEKDDKK